MTNEHLYNIIVRNFKKEEKMKKFITILCTFFISLSLFAAGDDNWFKAQTKKAPIKSITATSELIEAQFEGKYIYPPVNIVDGNFDNTWCEAEKNGPGIGESITIELTEPVSFDEIQIVNGFVSGKDYYTKNNRVKEIQITQVAKKHFQQKTYTLEDNKPDWQSIKFEQMQTAQTLTFKIVSVYKGTKYDDTCIDDVRLLYKGKVIPFENVAEIAKLQEENSKAMLESSSEDFEKDFMSLFNDYGLKNSDKNQYLVLQADNKKDVIIFTKYYNNSSVGAINYTSLYDKKTSNINDVHRSPDNSWAYTNTDNAATAAYKTATQKKIAPRVIPWSWYESYDYELKNCRIITNKTVSYVTTTTSTTVKLDGKNIYLNGVHYTIMDPSEVLVLNYWEDM